MEEIKSTFDQRCTKHFYLCGCRLGRPIYPDELFVATHKKKIDEWVDRCSEKLMWVNIQLSMKLWLGLFRNQFKLQDTCVWLQCFFCFLPVNLIFFSCSYNMWIKFCTAVYALLLEFWILFSTNST
jgi:hypothetical protein